MKRPVVASTFLLVASCLAPPASAQEDFTPPHTSSTISDGARFEIVQSQLAAKWTFRLDRMCGLVHQLVSTKDGGEAWEFMSIEDHPVCKMDGKAHYQLFSSSLAAKFTFLMNTDSGRTWFIVSKKDQPDEHIWETFEPDD
jgi:hypothetical protein